MSAIKTKKDGSRKKNETRGFKSATLYPVRSVAFDNRKLFMERHRNGLALFKPHTISIVPI